MNRKSNVVICIYVYLKRRFSLAVKFWFLNIQSLIIFEILYDILGHPRG